MKEKLNAVKEYLANLSRKTKIIAIAVLAAIIVGAIIITVWLNRKDYVTLYTDVTEEETTEILAKLQEMNVQYTSDGSGNIKVPTDVVDSTRAQLAQEGYPKSGFTYDVFTNNASGMTTDMEKQTYKLYDLQNRIGATVRLFDGVKDAKVTIALGEESKYVLSDSEDDSAGASASVVAIMKDGGSPTSKQAVGIQRLVAQSVPGMKLENVTVLDGNGVIVSDSEDGNYSGSEEGQEIARLIESQLAQKVVHVLEPFYGEDNIRVSAKGTVNTEKIIRESTTYTTPEKINEEDKTGILSKDTGSRESGGDAAGANGVVGTETNSDISQYTANANQNGNGYTSESWTRDYLVNQIKEQGEIDPGVLQDVTVSVAINGRTLGDLTTNKLQELVGNAVGIAPEDRIDKIAIANAPFYEDTDTKNRSAMEVITEAIKDNLLFVIIGVIVLLLLLAALFIVLRKRKKKQEEAEEEMLEETLTELPEGEGIEEGAETEEEEELLTPELLNIQNERSQELRERVRAFAEENPELSAQMLKNWLRGGDEDGN
ncbi:flagellar M-ring protein FliF [Lachnospiraceae bacterium MD308]|nr:flagellar M-ring protein FliF [Lachnospiraceae bacterium MD308]MCI8581083.1 flagellar M-ring protein FliF [Dorea sp.]